jgi:hypothetical protein
VSAKTSWQFNLTSATLAFCLWGGWAFYVNASTVNLADRSAVESADEQRAKSNDRASAWASGLTQGMGSFIITLVMVRSVAWFYALFSGRRLRLVLPALLTVAITGSCLVLAHTLVGTRSIVHTIAPALTVAFVFNVYATMKIHRSEKSESTPSEATS